MKHFSSHFSSGLFFIVFSLTFLSSGGLGWGKSPQSIDFHFEKVGLVPLEDRTDGLLGVDVDRLFLLKIEENLRFNVLISRLPAQSFPLNSRKILKLSRKHGLDGLITSFAELEGGKVKLGISLSNGSSGRIFAREFISFKDREKAGVMDQAVTKLVKKLLSRLPYSSWVLEVGEKGRSIKVNSGLFHGLGKGVIIDLYSLSGIKRSPLTGEFIGADEEKIGKLKIVEVGKFSATARIVGLKRGMGISGGEFFRFRPSGKILASVREEKLAALEKLREEVGRKAQISKPVKPSKSSRKEVKSAHPRGSLSLYAGPAWSRYKLSSSPLNLDRKTSAFFRAKTSGEYWIQSWLGVGGDLSHGVIKFDKVNSVSVSETARVFSLAAYFNFRLAGFWGDPASGLIGRVGFQRIQVKFSTTDSQFLTDTRYSGSLLGLELRLPIRQNLKSNIGVNYFPRLKVDESPVSSGEDPSSFGADFYIDGKLRLTERIWFSLRYEYSGFLTDFSGAGTRAGGITDAESKELLHSLLLGFSYDF